MFGTTTGPLPAEYLCARNISYPSPRALTTHSLLDLDSASCPSVEDLQSIHSTTSSNGSFKDDHPTSQPVAPAQVAPPRAAAPTPPSFTPAVPSQATLEAATYEDIEIRKFGECFVCDSI